MSDIQRNADYWRAKAKETRKLAIAMRDQIARQRMFELAASYEKRAERERQQQRQWREGPAE